MIFFEGSLSHIHVVSDDFVPLRRCSWELKPPLAPEDTAGNKDCCCRLDRCLLNISKIYRLLEFNQITYELKIATIKRPEHFKALFNKTKPFLMTQYWKPLGRQSRGFCSVADCSVTKPCSTAAEPAWSSSFLIRLKQQWTKSPNYSTAKTEAWMVSGWFHQGAKGSTDCDGDVLIFNQLQLQPKELQ